MLSKFTKIIAIPLFITLLPACSEPEVAEVPTEALVINYSFNEANGIVRANGLPIYEFIEKDGFAQIYGEFVFVKGENELSFTLDSGEADISVAMVPIGKFPDEVPPFFEASDTKSATITLNSFPTFAWSNADDISLDMCQEAKQKVASFIHQVAQGEYEAFIDAVITEEVLMSYQAQYPTNDFSNTKQDLLSGFNDFSQNYELIIGNVGSLECHLSTHEKLLEVTLEGRAYGLIAEMLNGPFKKPMTFDFVFMNDDGDLKLAF